MLGSLEIVCQAVNLEGFVGLRWFWGSRDSVWMGVPINFGDAISYAVSSHCACDVAQERAVTVVVPVPVGQNAVWCRIL